MIGTRCLYVYTVLLETECNCLSKLGALSAVLDYDSQHHSPLAMMARTDRSCSLKHLENTRLGKGGLENHLNWDADYFAC